MMFDPHSNNALVNLEKLATEGFEIIKDIEQDATKGLTVADTYYGYLFEILRSEFDSLESVSILVKQNKFKDCFTVLRSVFEVLLFFWLMVHGKIYRIPRTFSITPSEGKTLKEGRDTTLKKWRDGKSNNEPEYKQILEMQPEGEDRIRVLYEYEGLYDDKDKEKTGYFIPQYFFVLTEHYNQFMKFNAKLPSIKTGEIAKKETIEKNIREQGMIYSQYMYIDSIMRNLVLNNLISTIQEDYIKIHYNYLSSYIHPTKEMFQFTEKSTAYLKNDIPREIVAEQIWLYICRIQLIFLKILLERIDKYNPKASTEKYKLYIEKLNLNTSYFWFIDNEPTQYDILSSDQAKKFANKFAGKELDEIVMYYQDPLQRLYQFKSSRIK